MHETWYCGLGSIHCSQQKSLPRQQTYRIAGYFQGTIIFTGFYFQMTTPLTVKRSFNTGSKQWFPNFRGTKFSRGLRSICEKVKNSHLTSNLELVEVIMQQQRYGSQVSRLRIHRQTDRLAGYYYNLLAPACLGYVWAGVYQSLLRSDWVDLPRDFNNLPKLLFYFVLWVKIYCLIASNLPTGSGLTDLCSISWNCVCVCGPMPIY